MPTPEQMRAIARLPRRPQSPEHRQAISEGVRKAIRRSKPDLTNALTPKEHADYITLTRIGGFTRAEALLSIGRNDLIA